LPKTQLFSGWMCSVTNSKHSASLQSVLSDKCLKYSCNYIV